MDYFDIATAIKEKLPTLKRVEVERHWAFDDEDMPSVNIRETDFLSSRTSIKSIKSDFTFVVMFHAITKQATHEQDVKDYYAMRLKLIAVVLGVAPSIEFLGGKSVGEGAEFTYLGTTLTFKIRRCLNEI